MDLNTYFWPHINNQTGECFDFKEIKNAERFDFQKPENVDSTLTK